MSTEPTTGQIAINTTEAFVQPAPAPDVNAIATPPAGDAPPVVIVPAASEHPQAANIATAQALHFTHLQKIEHVGAWLYATAAGAFTSVEHAIEHILGKVPKV